MATETFKEKFLNDFNSRQGKNEEPGSAQASQIEIKSMRQLLRVTGGNQEARSFVIEHGFPLLKDEVGATDLGETAYKHLCVVAAYLYENRGETASADTVESYVTKNRFDRWMQFNLNKLEKWNGRIKQEWEQPQARDVENGNKEQVQYPEGVDDTKIYGVAKPHRYWPAQLLRYLEYMRLGKIDDPEEMEKLGLEKGDENKYKIEWDSFIPVLEKEESVDDIAIGIAVKTMEILKERGLSDERIAKVILVGYSPGGPLNEHGNIPQVHEIWSGIINRVEESENLGALKEDLLKRVEDKMTSTNKGYRFVYDPNR